MALVHQTAEKTSFAIEIQRTSLQTELCIESCSSKDKELSDEVSEFHLACCLRAGAEEFTPVGDLHLKRSLYNLQWRIHCGVSSYESSSER